MGAPHWLALFGVILLAWAALYAMAIPNDLRALSNIYGADFWKSLCVVTLDATGYGNVVLMWALMSAAMMLPTALPAFATYEDLGHQADIRFGRLVGGYLVVWIGFSLIAAAVQMVLFRVELISILGDSQSLWLSAVLLLVAGLYQFSPIKEA